LDIVPGLSCALGIREYKRYIRGAGTVVEIIIIIIISCHGVGPLVDPFRSHVPRSYFKGLHLPGFFP